MRADIVAALGENGATQANGDPPTTLAAGSAPGEIGVAVFCHRFCGGMHFRNTSPHHFICFQISPTRVEFRMAGQVLRHKPPSGSLTIHPAWLTLAAAEGSERQAELIERVPPDAKDDWKLVLTLPDSPRLGLRRVEPCAQPDVRQMQTSQGRAADGARSALRPPCTPNATGPTPHPPPALSNSNFQPRS